MRILIFCEVIPGSTCRTEVEECDREWKAVEYRVRYHVQNTLTSRFPLWGTENASRGLLIWPEPHFTNTEMS